MQDLTRSRNLNGLDAARMFALVNMAMHDALWLTFTGKFELRIVASGHGDP